MTSSRGIRRSRTSLELGVLVISLAATGAIVAGLVVAGVSGGDGGPDVRACARPTGVEPSGSVIYEVEIRNLGGQTAENVTLEVSVGNEVREIEVLSVAKGDSETLTLVFPPGTDSAATVRWRTALPGRSATPVHSVGDSFARSLEWHGY